MKDFFISYNKADRAWAEWIAWELEEAAYSVVIQAWDFRPGSNFVLEMDEALKEAERMLAVLSPDYISSRFTAPEWAAAFARDSTGGDRRLVPVRVREVDLSGLLAQIVYADLVGTHDEAASRTLLLDAVQRGRAKPKQKPAFPGAPPRAIPEQPRFPGALPAIWNVPHNRNRNFTGRADLLSTLRSQLQEGHHSALTALHGLGGIGKTQTALEYAYRYAVEYALVWWLRSEDPTTLAGDYALLAAKLDLPEAAADHQTAIASVKQWLSKSDGWLLVFDNAADPQEIAAYLPPSASGHVIITSRRPDWRSVAAPLPVETMNADDAIEFLYKRSGQQHEIAARELVDELGFLPLAIEQAAAYIDEHGQSISQYLDLYRKHQQQILKKGRPRDYPHTLETTWELAIAKVREQSPAGADLLNLCAFFAPDDIPLEIIRDRRERLPEPLATTAGDELSFDDAVASLRRHSLVERNEDNLSVHRLVQAVVRDRMVKDARAIWAESAARIVRNAFPFDADDVNEWPGCVRLLAHATTIAFHCEAERAGQIYAAGLLSQSALYLYSRADWGGAVTLNRRAVKLLEATYGSDHPDLIPSLSNLGCVLQEIGDFGEASKLLKRALNMSERVYGSSDPRVAACMNNLGLALEERGDLAGAKELYERALRIDEASAGPDHSVVAVRVNNLGGVYLKLGNSTEAQKLYERALEIGKKVYGADHPQVGIYMSNLGIVLMRLKSLRKARAYFEMVLQIDEAAYGPDHPQVATDVNNLAWALKELGDSAGAQTLFERAVQIGEKTYGLAHWKVAMYRDNLRNSVTAAGAG